MLGATCTATNKNKCSWLDGSPVTVVPKGWGAGEPDTDRRHTVLGMSPKGMFDGPSSPLLPPPISPLFPSTCPSLPLLFGRSNVGVNLSRA